jgi:hypothetical protein
MPTNSLRSAGKEKFKHLRWKIVLHEKKKKTFLFAVRERKFRIVFIVRKNGSFSDAQFIISCYLATDKALDSALVASKPH